MIRQVQTVLIAGAVVLGLTGVALAQGAALAQGVGALAQGGAANPPAVRTILQQADVAANPAQETFLGTVDIAPGSGNGRHSHNGTEMGFVVSGRIQLNVDGQPPRLLGPGDSFLVPRGVIHQSVLVGNEAARLVSTWTVDKDKPLMVPAP
jgi:quercetin dioxygenase-like cupin family protein